MHVISVFLAFLFLIPASSAFSASWDYSSHSIPIEEIQSGGPPKHGIPSLSSPKYVKAADADFMRDEEQVLGVYHNRIARAYMTARQNLSGPRS